MSNNPAVLILVPASTVNLMGVADDERITALGLFIEAYASVIEAIERELDQVTDLSGPEVGVLLRLVRTPDHHLRMSDLAAGAGLSTSGMTRLVDRLESAGLLERKACPNDRRGLEAVLTPKGRKLVEQIVPAHLDSIQRHVVEPLGGDLSALERTMRVLRDSARSR
jgi:MarR family transcriptional regulator, 2-MHQ and catechol-resistance regulon repressor